MKKLNLDEFEKEMIAKSLEDTAECDFDNLEDAQEFAKQMFLDNTARRGFFRRKRDGSITYSGYTEYAVICRIINKQIKELWNQGYFRKEDEDENQR
jgi:hypothetical protein